LYFYNASSQEQFTIRHVGHMILISSQTVFALDFIVYGSTR
jgi:hypothetical protein